MNAEAVVDNFNRQLADLLVGLAVNPFFAGVDEKITVVDDLTFTVPPGRVPGFLGSIGSGKSTTIKIMLDLCVRGSLDPGRVCLGAGTWR